MTKPVSIDIEAFRTFVARKHQGQTYSDGPYELHLMRVAERARKKLSELPEGLFAEFELAQFYCLGLGHDLIEDCAKTEVERQALCDEILSFGFDPEFIDWVYALSRLDTTMEYQAWIKKMGQEAPFPVILIKLSDNEDNGDPENIAKLPPERRSISRRYERAHSVLEEAYDTRVTDLLKSSPPGL